MSALRTTKTNSWGGGYLSSYVVRRERLRGGDREAAGFFKFSDALGEADSRPISQLVIATRAKALCVEPNTKTCYYFKPDTSVKCKQPSRNPLHSNQKTEPLPGES